MKPNEQRSRLLLAELRTKVVRLGTWGKGQLIYNPFKVSAENISAWPTRRVIASLRHAAHQHGQRDKYTGRRDFQYRRKSKRRPLSRSADN